MKTEIVWRADPNGIVRGPRYHDSQIVHFAYSQTRRLMSFVMQHNSREYTRCDASGIVLLSVNELWEGTTVADFFAWKASLVAETLPDSAWHGLFPKRYQTGSDAKRDVARIAQERPDTILIQIQGSYGGDISGLCERLTFWKLEPDDDTANIVLDPTMG